MLNWNEPSQHILTDRLHDVVPSNAEVGWVGVERLEDLLQKFEEGLIDFGGATSDACHHVSGTGLGLWVPCNLLAGALSGLI